MKKNVLIFLILFTTSNLFSQIDKGDVIITFKGNYNHLPSENGVKTNQNYTESKTLNVGTSVGYLISKSFVAGIGLDYNWSKEARLNTLSINRFYQQELMNIRSKVFLPNVYLGYYYQISNKLFINTNLKFSYGKIKSEINSMRIGGTAANPLETFYYITDRYVIENVSKSEVEISSLNICPELTYFIFTKVGFSLGFGGVEYNLTDWEKDNSGWIINFHPNSWRFGIKISI